MSTLVGTRGGNVITIITLPPLVAEVRSNSNTQQLLLQTTNTATSGGR